MGFFDDPKIQSNSTQLPSINSSDISGGTSGGGFFNDPKLQTTVAPATQSSSGFFDDPNLNPNADKVDNSNALQSVSISDPWGAIKTTYHGALNDIGTVTSGIGKILWTPVQVSENLIQGNSAFQNTIIQNLGDVASGIFGQLTGGQTTDSWEALKSYYGQYGSHPLDMIANHPINTLLDIASILDLGSTSVGFVGRVGEVNDLLEQANVLRKAGDFDAADEISRQATTSYNSSLAGKIANGMKATQEAINPFRAAGELYKNVLGQGGEVPILGSIKLGSRIPALDDFNNWIQHFTNRSTNLGLDATQGGKFNYIADQLKGLRELYNKKFIEEIDPVLKPLVNNTPLADKIAEDLDRPGSMNLSPYEQAIRDQIMDVINKHITEPERAGGLLKNWIDGGYLEHIYEDKSPKGFFGKMMSSFKVNAPNDKAAQILRFEDIVDETKPPVIGTADYNNFTEVNKDAEIEKIENTGNDKITKLQSENTRLTKGLFDNQLQDLLTERKTLLAQRSALAEREIAHPEDFQTNLGDLGNALDLQYKSTRDALIENNLKLQDEIAKLKTQASTEIVEGTGKAKIRFADQQDKLVYNLQQIQKITNQIAEDSKVYNTSMRLFKDGEGNLLTGKRTTAAEAAMIGYTRKDIIESLDHRMNTSAMNQAKINIGDKIGQEFGTLEKPSTPLNESGEKMVLSKTIRNAAGQYYYVPESIESAAKNFFEQNAKGEIVTALSMANKWFKRSLFANHLSAAAHEIHLAIMGVLGGIDPIDTIRAWKGIRDGDAISARFNAQMGKTGIEGLLEPKTTSLKERLETEAGGIKATAKNVINPTNQNFLGMNVTSNALEHTDNFLRQTILRKALQQGQTWDEAILTTQKFMGNYANLTPFEKNLQAVFPFYNWMKQSIPASARALTDAAPRLDFARIFGAGVNPNSEQEGGKFDSGFKDKNNNEVYLNPPIQIKDIRNMFLDAPDFMWSRINPAITVPFDIAANSKQPFNSDPNFTTLNQLHQPNTSALDPYNIGQELNFAAGQFTNPIKVGEDGFGTSATSGWSKQVLESMGIYESSYDPIKSAHYDTVDLQKAISSLQKSYNKAVKNKNTPQAAFYQSQIRMYQAQLKAGN